MGGGCITTTLTYTLLFVFRLRRGCCLAFCQLASIKVNTILGSLGFDYVYRLGSVWLLGLADWKVGRKSLHLMSWGFLSGCFVNVVVSLSLWMMLLFIC
jgi:hypothetical protein